MAELASDRVYANLKERIILEEIAGNTLISEGEIADELHVSRTPVREAFLRLQAEGWMRLYPKRGALVVGIDPAERHEILEARTLIETWAAQAVTAQPDVREALAAKLEQTLEEQREALGAKPDRSAFSVADLHFHQLIVEAAGNSLLTAVYRQLSDRQRRMTAHAVVGPERATRVLDHHRDLLAAIRDGDSAAFATHLTHHFTDIHKEISR